MIENIYLKGVNMANDLNRCEFIGNLGNDPDIRYTADGGAVANLSIACNWKTKNGEGTEWIPLVAFGKLAEIINQYLTKGAKVYVAGRFRTERWEDRDGNTRYSTKVYLETMQMLGGGSNQGGGNNQRPPQQHSQQAQQDNFDDIPF